MNDVKITRTRQFAQILPVDILCPNISVSEFGTAAVDSQLFISRRVQKLYRLFKNAKTKTKCFILSVNDQIKINYK